MKILVIEDNEHTIELLKRYFEKSDINGIGYEFISTTNPEDGVNMILDEKPDAVLLDIMFSDPCHDYVTYLNGYDIYNYVKEHPEINCRFYVISAISDKYTIKENIEIQDKNIFQKPFNALEIIEQIRKDSHSMFI